MKTTYIKKVVFILFLLSSSFIYSQYNGGDSDGFSSSSLNNTSCSYPTQFIAYNGGDSSLTTINSLINTTCNAPNQFFAYNGGNGDGFAFESINAVSCANPNQFYAYFGGNGDGFSSETINAVSCATPSQFYAYFGGNADGFSVGSTAPACPTAPPVADFTASATTICVGQSVTFTDTSTNSPSAWTWTFTGGTPNSSTVQNPVVVYNSPGTYTVTLLAANFNGNDTETKTAYITVNAIPTVTTTTPASRCDSGTVTLQATASSGATLNWYAAATGGTALSSGTSFTTPSLTATNTYYVEAQFGTCISARTAVIATVNTTPSITATTPASRCGTGSVTLQATASAGTIQWFADAAGGTALFTGANYTTPSLTTTTSYFVQVSQNGCISPRTEVVATINAIPTITGTTPASRCDTGTVILEATASVGTISWYATATGGTALATGTSFTTPSLSTTTTYYVGTATATCTSTRTAVIATVNTTPSITGTTPGSVCDSGTVSLSASTSAGTISWYAAASGGTVLGTGATFITPSLTATTTYYAEASNGSCTSARTAVIATVNTTPTITGTTPASRCGNGSVTLQATANVGTIRWFGSATGGSVLATGTSYVTPNLNSSTTYYVEVTQNNCTSPRTAVLATINTIPTITGTTPANRCGDGSVTLQATASSGTISWYATATGGTALATGGSFTTPSLSATTTYYVETNNGTCNSSRTAVVATINAMPMLTGTTPASRCGNGTVTLQATASSGTISWYTTATGGTALATGGSFVTPILTTTTTYYVEAANATCTTTRVPVVATINPGASISSTTPASRCGNGTVTLQATASSGTISWYATATGGTALATGGSFTTPSLTATTTYYVETDNDTCNSGRTAVIATINVQPTITGTIPANRCGNGSMTLQATASSGTISWYASATGGTALATGGSFTTPSLSATTTFYVESINGTCNSGRTAVVATINVQPSITSTTPANRCGNGTVTLQATASSGTISWYATATGGIALATGGSFTTPSLSATTTYYVEAANGTCNSVRTAVVATISNTAAPTGAVNQTFCVGETIGLINVNGTDIIWYDASTGGNIVDSTTPIVSDVTYYASQTLNSCESSTRLAVTMTLGNCLGVDDFVKLQMTLYPNPTKDYVIVNSSQIIQKVEVINLLGQTLFTQQFNNKEVKVYLDNLPTATYLLRVTSDNKLIKMFKVLKE
jgi:PKD repeat protein